MCLLPWEGRNIDHKRLLKSSGPGLFMYRLYEIYRFKYLWSKSCVYFCSNIRHNNHWHYWELNFARRGKQVPHQGKKHLNSSTHLWPSDVGYLAGIGTLSYIYVSPWDKSQKSQSQLFLLLGKSGVECFVRILNCDFRILFIYSRMSWLSHFTSWVMKGLGLIFLLATVNSDETTSWKYWRRTAILIHHPLFISDVLWNKYKSQI